MGYETDDFKVVGRPGPSVQDLMRADTRPVPKIFVEDQNDYAADLGEPVSPAKFISPEFHKLEVDRMWNRVWQIAAHEDQIQNVGDYVVYDIADKSIIVVRTAPDTIKAYYNACLHRGRMLCEKDGHAANFRCKFHGFMWKLDGSLGFVPSKWDFPDLKEDEFRLPEAKVGTWAGWVFINLDPDAASLEDYLGDMPQHFTTWNFKNRHLVGHVAKVMRCNWKVAAEAFMEFYHGMTTHPQAIGNSSDVATRYVARRNELHFSHMIIPNGIASPFLGDRLSEQQILDNTLMLLGLGGDRHILPEGMTARAYFADLQRAQLKARTGRDFSRVSDTELVDHMVYCVFPNLTLWGAYTVPHLYRYRPFGNDPEMCVMDIYILPEFPEGAPRPPAPKTAFYGPDVVFPDDSPELGAQGGFFNQDLGNLEWVQKGLHTFAKDNVAMARYQESMNRHFHVTLDTYLRGETPGR